MTWYAVEVQIRGRWQLLAERVTERRALTLINQGEQIGISTRKVPL